MNQPAASSTHPAEFKHLLLPILLASLALLLAACNTSTQPNPLSPSEIASTNAELQSVLDSWRNEEKITGATMSIYTPALGQLDLASGLYKRSIEPDRFPDEQLAAHQPMFAGDLAHVLVAATTIQLAKEGSVNLHKTIDQWFPAIENSSNITVRNLLEHTSGIPVFYTEEFLDVLYEQRPNQAQDPDDVIAVAAAEGSFFPPNSQYGYSKTNYIVLGRIIENITGNALESELRNRFFTPLGMNDSYLGGRESIPGATPSGFEYAGPFSDAPTVVDGHVPQTPAVSIISAEWASGALVSTPADIVKLIQAIFENDEFEYVKKEMLSVADHPAQESASTRIDSGAGVFVWEEGNEQVVGQFGFIYPFSAQFVYRPESKTLIAVIANEVDSSRNPNSNFQLPVIENLLAEVKTIIDSR
jgi:D-alanyl-D-alanine carboxypeptidase